MSRLSQPLLLQVASWRTTRGTPSRDHAIDPQRFDPNGLAKITFCGRPVPHDSERDSHYVGAGHEMIDWQTDACARCGLTRQAIVEAVEVPLCLAPVSCSICREQVLLREQRKAERRRQRRLYEHYLMMSPWQPSWKSALVDYT